MNRLEIVGRKWLKRWIEVGTSLCCCCISDSIHHRSKLTRHQKRQLLFKTLYRVCRHQKTHASGSCLSQYLLLRPRMGAKYCHEYICFFVCLSTCITCKPCGWTSPNFIRMLPVAVAWSSSDSVGILCYVLPVLWMMSYFHLIAVWHVMYISKQR